MNFEMWYESSIELQKVKIRIYISQFSETWFPNSWDITFFFDTFTDSMERMENTSKDFLDF